MKCHKGTYVDNSVIFHSPIVCWGFEDQPKCEFLLHCINSFEKACSKDKNLKRTWNRLLKKAKNEKVK